MRLVEIALRWLLGHPERVFLSSATTAYGRLFLTIESVATANANTSTTTGVSELIGSTVAASSTTTTKTEYRVNITLSQRFATDPPPGGLALRIRAPGYLVGQRITAATVGGKALPSSAINASAEVVHFPTLPLLTATFGEHSATKMLESIVVTVG
eukprot:SAG31_NODE_6038_length_2197_cov_1.579123_1_plen_156_part_00